MSRTPLDTLLAERLRSARGLGWEGPARKEAPPASDKPPHGDQGRVVVGQGSAPAWFRVAYHTLRSLGFAR